MGTQTLELAAIDPSRFDPADIRKARQFLSRYGINEKKLSDVQVIEKTNKINAAYQAKAEVLSRGRVTDSISRVLEHVPEGFVGELKGDNENDIKLAEAMGWKLFVDKKAGKASSTGTSDGIVRVGDQVLMMIPEEDYVAILMARDERRRERRRARDPKNRNKETQGFAHPVFDLTEHKFSGEASNESDGAEVLTEED